MTNFSDLRQSLTAARAALDAAQSAERDARRAHHEASTTLAKTLFEHVQPLYAKDEVRQTKAFGEIQIVAIRVETYDPATVKAVFVTRIKSGNWGKSRTTSRQLIWDFERNAWTEC